MLDFNIITELSRANCVSICAFLVPANLLATSSTITLAALRRPTHQVWQACAIATFFAVVMILHVYTWFAIGVVMAPTYILMWLAITCLISNFGAILLQRHFPKILSFGR
jgi:pheromone shutdown protein TraB